MSSVPTSALFVALACSLVGVGVWLSSIGPPLSLSGHLPSQEKHCGLRLAKLFTDGMVLQKGPKRHVIWGFTRCKEGPIEVRETCPNGVNIFTTEVLPERTPKFPGKEVYYAWKATIPPAEESHAPCQLTVKQYGHIQTVKVFFGDVWICNGQSNMEQPAFKDNEGINESSTLSYSTFKSGNSEVKIYQNIFLLKITQHGKMKTQNEELKP